MNVQKSFFTLKELADLNVRGLPSAVKNLREKANNENWKKRKRQGRGGGFEYDINSMSQELQAGIALKLSAMQISLDTSGNFRQEKELKYSPELLWQRYEQKSDKQKEKAKNKLRAVKAVVALNKQDFLLKDAFDLVSKQEQIALPSLRRWYYSVQKFEENDWLPALLTHDGENRQNLESEFTSV